MKYGFKILTTFLLILQSFALLSIFSLPSIVYYFSLVAILSIVIIFSLGSEKFNGLFMGFWFFTLISILLNDIPSIFQHKLRFLLFSIMFFAFSPLIHNSNINSFRIFTFNTYSKIFLALSMLSIITLLLGVTPINGSSVIRGFQGIFNHPNTLGPIVSIAFFYVLVKMNNIKKYIYFTILFGLISIALLSGSRSVLLGIFVTFIGYSYIKKYINFKGILIAVLVFSTVYYLFINSYIEIKIITQKIEYSKNQESVTASRDILWGSRIKEILSSPIYGIGVSAVDLYHYNVEMSNNNSADTGTVETGSAWLGIFSMTGILGGLAFIILYFKGLKNCLNYIKFSNDYLLSFLILLFFGVQFVFEGNIFAAGSPIMLFFWTTISISFLKPKIN